MTQPGPTMPGPGSVLLGRFRIESVLGEGGMGIVFGARRIPSDEPVAIKVLLPEASAHPEAIPRFINEARATMKLASQHVVKVHEAGTLDIGLPFIVMELLSGTDLAAVLEKQRKLPVAAAVDYIIQACDAVAEAHALGIVHRDLKPSNLFLYERPGGTPYVKVLDFGISKVSTPQNQALTATGTFLGSPHYMPPEQLKSAKGVDARADQWALGVILYELLGGEPPFDARAFGELFMKVLTAEFTPLRALRPEVPEALEQIVHRCLRRPREERFRDLVELAQALAPFASPDGARAAQRVGQPKTAPAPDAPPPPRRGGLGSTALLLDRPPLPASVHRASTPSFPASAPQHGPPSFAPGPHSVPYAGEPSHRPLSQPFAPPPRASYSMQPPHQASGAHPAMSSGALPRTTPSQSGPAPFGYAPQPPLDAQQRASAPGAAPAPRSRLVIGLVIGAVLIALVGIVLIVLATRSHRNAPAELPNSSAGH